LLKLVNDDVKVCGTYGAASSRRAVLVVGTAAVLAIAVLAVANHVVTHELDGEVKLGIGGRCVLEDGEPCHAVAVSNTKVERSIVAKVAVRASPLAAVRDGCTGRVDVVLGRGTLSLPLVVILGRRHREVLGSAWLSVKRDSLAFSAWVVGTAHGSLLAHGVLDKDSDFLRTRNA